MKSSQPLHDVSSSTPPLQIKSNVSSEKKNFISVPKKYLSMSQLITGQNIPNLKIASPGTASLPPSSNVSKAIFSSPLRSTSSHTMTGN